MAGTYAYWISTALLTVLYLSSALMYLLKGALVRRIIGDLGYNAPHLVPLMIVVKILGPAAILSRVSVALSDLAYAGMLFHLLLAAIAYLAVGKIKEALPAIVGLALLAASFATQNSARETPSPYAPQAFAASAMR